MKERKKAFPYMKEEKNFIPPFFFGEPSFLHSKHHAM
jgi:hypothetical protein